MKLFSESGSYFHCTFLDRRGHFFHNLNESLITSVHKHIKGSPAIPYIAFEEGRVSTSPAHNPTAIKNRSKSLISLSLSHTHTHTQARFPQNEHNVN
jgi:hypothetical protein